MTTASLFPQTTGRAPSPRALAAPFLTAVAAAHVPLVAFQLAGMWRNPEYDVFPLVWLGAGVLAWRDTRGLGPLAPGPAKTTSRLLTCCWILLAAAGLWMSPMLGCAAGLVTLLTLAFAAGGRRLVRVVFPAWCFLWLSLPRPWLDQALGQLLRRTAAAWSSSLLDVLGIFHVPEGLTITVPGTRLMVEDACSGFHSLTVILSGVVFLALFNRLRTVQALGLLAAGAFWSVAANTARIVVVGWAAAHWGADLSVGWRHEALGLATVVVILGLVASTACLYHLCDHGIVRPGLAQTREFFGCEMESEGPLPCPDDAPLEPTPWADARADVPATAVPSGGLFVGRGFATAYALLAVAMVAWLWPWIVAAPRTAMEPSRTVSSLGAFTRAYAESGVEGFRSAGFREVRRSRGNSLGEFSKVWEGAVGARPASLSIDYPFAGWHEVTKCYENAGWKVASRTVRDGEHGRYVEADLVKEPGRHATLFFSQCDGQGVSVGLNEREWSWLDRVAVWRASTLAVLRGRFEKSQGVIQSQMFVSGHLQAKAPDREQARRTFLAFRDGIGPALGTTQGRSK